ncbi:putative polysaccharide biosynthesis protein [Anaerocolumna chitinilytica]|uniref:Stage V sporulation protein B n=1 Tax=Anaerocolumna chitinilytica TaxID=1727145 RepID=A0A7M3SAW0_9FIRM|nr:polysaccharide biosynthesis protein [Anaerocolumna chitinilytica]BCK01728.1 stage V sporulation protein B [Anaerocolumna chitinilytica]
MENQNRKNNFVRQAGVLAIAGIISRIIGILYKSPLIALIGVEGIAYYNYAGNVYLIMLLISSYSIPSAVSKEIAKKLIIHENKNAQRIFYCSLLYVLIVGGIFSAFTYFGAGLFVENNSVLVLRLLAPAIFLSGFLGVFRGYFQGHNDMVHSSLSQILEQIFNAVFSLLAAGFFIKSVSQADTTKRAVYGAMGSALGTAAGVLFGLIFMVLIYLSGRKPRRNSYLNSSEKQPEPYAKIIRNIFFYITPFIISTCIYNMTAIFNQTLYTKILIYGKGISADTVSAGYGIYSGEAIIFTTIPIAIASSISSAMLPDIAGAFSLGNIKETKRRVDMAIRFAMLICIPAAVGLFVLSKPIIYAMFPLKSTLKEASDLLRCLSITSILYGLSTISNGVLQGIGKLKITTKNALLSLFIQTAVLAVLLSYTGLNLYALVIAAIIHSFLMCVLNASSMTNCLKFEMDLKKSFVIPLTAAVFMGILAGFLYDFLHSTCHSNILSLILTITVSAVVYFVAVIWLGGISESEITALPQGKILAAIAKWLKLF